MRTYCVYHRVDFDGKCSAAIVRRLIPEAVLIPYQYGDPLDLRRFEEQDLVIMVDCSLQPFERMVDLSRQCNLFWIDHHKTAIEDYERAGAPFDARLDSSYAGCELTWWWANPDTAPPSAVQMLGRYDVWDHESSEDVLPFQFGMRRYAGDPADEVFWKPLLAGNQDRYQEILGAGRIALEFAEELYADACRGAFETIFDGLRCICLNMPRANSQAFKSVWDPERHDAMLSFSNSGRKHWTVSLYTMRPDVDVGAVAKARGGGGHQKAAGFQIRELPRELCPAS